MRDSGQGRMLSSHPDLDFKVHRINSQHRYEQQQHEKKQVQGQAKRPQEPPPAHRVSSDFRLNNPCNGQLCCGLVAVCAPWKKRIKTLLSPFQKLPCSLRGKDDYRPPGIHYIHLFSFSN